jgi:hypothetical protein
MFNDLLNTNYRKKLIPANMAYKKEDLYEQNITLKMNINDYKDDNVRLRTRLQQLVAQIRGRDKLIEELYKSAYITLNGSEAGKNLNRDHLLLLNLKREVYTLKDQLYARDDEIVVLKMNSRFSKIQELETELKAYVAECMRLRKMTENAIKLSGEIDVMKIQRQALEKARSYDEAER